MAADSDHTKSFVKIYQKLTDMRINMQNTRVFHANKLVDLLHENTETIARFTRSPTLNDKQRTQITNDLKNKLEAYYAEVKLCDALRDTLFKMISSAIDRAETRLTTTKPPYLMSEYIDVFGMLDEWIDRFDDEHRIFFRFPSRFTVNDDNTIYLVY